MSMDFGRACGLGGLVGNTRGDPWCGRPTRYARRRATIGSPLFTYLPCCLLTLKHVRTCTALSRTLYTPQHGTSSTPCLHTMAMHQDTSSTFLAYKSKPEVDFYHVSTPFAHLH